MDSKNLIKYQNQCVRFIVQQLDRFVLSYVLDAIMFENPTDETRRALRQLFEQHQRKKFRRALEEHLCAVKKLKDKARKDADHN